MPPFLKHTTTFIERNEEKKIDENFNFLSFCLLFIYFTVSSLFFIRVSPVISQIYFQCFFSLRTKKKSFVFPFWFY